ncbi:alkaline phosphatase PhoX [Marinobacterium sp. LSUCC0821]|uniref:alkaline phosphatase PhoX n=1 Tax=Marinobacterium sp. LSUCC0821 TaxID=2668067 RepID=UPI0014513131|nr:alkaline phosphatase PhoX [Marinobacterium sp. LSUCC0821]QJD71825.1 DUF839 domain-containing protein [Marinobacterium sp. LSUCC0821]
MKSVRYSLLALAVASATANAVEIHRYATVPLGAEVTGMAMVKDDLFFNVQHPEIDNKTINLATVGYVANADFSQKLELPQGLAKETVTVAGGNYGIIGQSGVNGLGLLKRKDGSQYEASDDPDFNGFIPTNDAQTEGYLFTNWENTPGGMSRMFIKREGNAWVAKKVEMLDFTSVGGTWINCAGSVSPWGTPISSEELYWDNTADWFNPKAEEWDGVASYNKYAGTQTNPYRVGWNVEITDPKGKATPRKLTTLGRFSHENVSVMNDQKTVYQSDDGTNTVFFKFVADKAADLTAGTLYAAKASTNKDESLNIEWVKLAHGTKAQIDTWVAEYDKGGFISDEEIADWAAGNAKDDRVAFLESRKAAAAKGASNEFRKMEVVRADAAGKNLYMAMSEVAKGMSDGKGDVQVTENKCGIVYHMGLDANFNVSKMTPWVVGKPEGKVCSTEGISNPDNLWPLGNGVVLIGEDTSKHENNMIWVARD